MHSMAGSNSEFVWGILVSSRTSRQGIARAPRRGGRGKAGGIQRAASLEEANHIIARLSGSTVRGRPIHGFRVEQRVDFVHEAYVSLSVDATEARMRLMVSTD